MVEIAAKFSEEDLTRYLQLSLDLFRDLQFSLQPRFHLEIGLVRLVQAGKLQPIEEALAALQSGSPTAPAPGPRPAAPAPHVPRRLRKAPRRSSLTAPARPNARRSRKPRPARPQPRAQTRPGPRPPAPGPREPAPPPAGSIGVAHQTRHRADRTRPGLHRRRRGAFAGGGIRRRTAFTTPADFELAMNADEINKAVRQVAGRPMRIKVTIGETGPVPQSAAPGAAKAGGRRHRARALPSRSAAVPGIVRRRGPGRTKPEGVET